MSADLASDGAVTPREAQQVAKANASSRTPVVFIHGLWALASVWDRWVTAFEEAGYVALTPGWPGDPETVAAANKHPEAFARQRVAGIVDHLEGIIGGLAEKPVVVGHSFGGLLTQILAGHGVARVSVAISPAPFRGVLPLPVSTLRSVLPVLGHPANRRRVLPLSYAQFRYAVANATSEPEARELYGTHGVPACGRLVFQDAFANLNPATEVRVDTRNPGRGPLLIISGEKDRFLPPAIARASYRRQRSNEAVTEIAEIPGRGHSLTFDSGWREVAEIALEFVGRAV
ncbi:MAG TPA: alpha/beta hydrolase [Acidimicrobiales bacterium]|nr:alpha/beta hydrolase [Acidimicrobiales bacterium]